MRRRTQNGLFVPIVYTLKVPLLLQSRPVLLLTSNSNARINLSLQVVVMAAMAVVPDTAAKAAADPLAVVMASRADTSKGSPAMVPRVHKVADLQVAVMALHARKVADLQVVVMVLHARKVVDAPAVMAPRAHKVVDAPVVTALRVQADVPAMVLHVKVVAPECRKNCW